MDNKDNTPPHENVIVNPPIAGVHITDPAIATYALEKIADLRKKEVGCLHNEKQVTQFSFTFNRSIIVNAIKIRENEWRFIGTLDCNKVIEGIVTGGKRKVMKYTKFIRNGILSLANKGKVNKDANESEN